MYSSVNLSQYARNWRYVTASRRKALGSGCARPSVSQQVTGAKGVDDKESRRSWRVQDLQFTWWQGRGRRHEEIRPESGQAEEKDGEEEEGWERRGRRGFVSWSR